ncbi:hypothetical protein [Actinokineospora inagensis]|uniref:hypothetical protein n=1 Tax=Actinokineospora inagensis TaxID=103730 RepID=UPI00047EDF8C|nr:hypothetical protein [Actinokineospora inagensis]
MTIAPRPAAKIFGALLLLVGILLLATPTSTSVAGTDVQCGDAMKGVAHNINELLTEDCESAIGTRRSIGWPLAGAGALILVGAAVVRTPPREAPA